MSEDEQHLRLLSIFHYILGCLMALFACFPIVHLAIGAMLLIAPETLGDQHREDMPPFLTTVMGLMFTVIPLMLIVLGWSLAICLFVAGRFLDNHSHHTFCLVVAGVSCMFVPFGTVLGVFTIVVLLRPSVKLLFLAGSTNNPFK